MLELKILGKKIVDRIYEDRFSCMVCHNELVETNRYGLCKDCLEEIAFIKNNKVCSKCGKPIDNESDYCLTCQNNDRYFNRNTSPLAYKGKVIDLIINYKYKYRRYLGKYLATFMIDQYIDARYDADIIVPIPSTTLTAKKRGFDHIIELSEIMSERLKIPVASDVIIKVKETERQALLGGKARQENVLGAYKLCGDIRDKKVLLIDDILTTGATLSEVSRTLLKGKPRNIEGLTLANAEYKLYLA